MTISGKWYSGDPKIINGKVIPDWWWKAGHNVDIKDVPDILDTKLDIIVIGSGSSGFMEVSDRLKQRCDDRWVGNS